MRVVARVGWDRSWLWPGTRWSASTRCSSRPTREDHPGSRWLVGDLATLDLRAQGVSDGFDAIVCAGNVMTFLAVGTRREVLGRLRVLLRVGGRVVVGFGAGRGYGFEDFFVDVAAAALVVDLRLSTWDLRPWTVEADFLVAVLRPA